MPYLCSNNAKFQVIKLRIRILILRLKNLFFILKKTEICDQQERNIKKNIFLNFIKNK